MYLLLLSVLLYACKSNTKQPVKDSLPAVAKTDTPKSLTATFKGIINGEWIKSDYMDEIAKTRSPLKAWPKAFSITGIGIDVDSIKGDSVSIGINYTYHEGNSLTLKFRKGRAPNAVPFYSNLGDIDNRTFELGYQIANGDTALIVYTYNSKGKLESRDRFTRLIANPETTNNQTTEASYYRINQLVMAGSYQLTDSLNNHIKVEFKSNGTITGLPPFDSYSLGIDFMTPPNEADVVYFKVGEKNSDSYIYRFNKDTLNLYVPKFDKDSVQLLIDKLKYKMVRQK